MTDNELQQKRLVAAAIDIGVYIAIFVALRLVGGVGSLITRQVASDHTLMAGMYLSRIVDFITAFLGLVYMLGRDLLAGGRSLGKQLMDIRVLTAAGRPIEAMDSVKRNAIFAFGALLNMIRATFQLIPCLGDAVACLMLPLFFLSVFIGIATVIVEIVKITTEPAGVRFGDQWAGTRVTR